MHISLTFPGISAAATQLKREAADPRWFQLIFQAGFLAYGLGWLQWHVQWLDFAAIFIGCLGTQYLFIANGKVPAHSLKSAAITGMGLSLLLRASSPWYLLLAAVLSILSKFLLRANGKHFFNPANFGIVTTVMATGEAWISPGQWGTAPILIFLSGAAGYLVLAKVQRWDVCVAFLGTFAMLMTIRYIGYLGWGWDVLLHRLLNGSLLLFSFFMITDPVSAPNHRIVRIIWGMAVAALAFYWAEFQYMQGTPIKALVLFCLLTPLLDYIFKGKNFQWPGIKGLSASKTQHQ